MPSALGVFKFYLSAIIRRSTFIKPGSYLFSFRQHLFRLTYALYRQNYVYTLQIKANLSYVKLKTLTATSVQAVPLSVNESQGFQLNLNSFLLQGIS